MKEFRKTKEGGSNRALLEKEYLILAEGRGRGRRRRGKTKEGVGGQKGKGKGEVTCETRKSLVRESSKRKGKRPPTRGAGILSTLSEESRQKGGRQIVEGEGFFCSNKVFSGKKDKQGRNGKISKFHPAFAGERDRPARLGPRRGGGGFLLAAGKKYSKCCTGLFQLDDQRGEW